MSQAYVAFDSTAGQWMSTRLVEAAMQDLWAEGPGACCAALWVDAGSGSGWLRVCTRVRALQLGIVNASFGDVQFPGWIQAAVQQEGVRCVEAWFESHVQRRPFLTGALTTLHRVLAVTLLVTCKYFMHALQQFCPPLPCICAQMHARIHAHHTCTPHSSATYTHMHNTV